MYYERYEFVTSKPFLAIPCLVILGVSSVIGTFGNVFLLIVLFVDKSLHTRDFLFIVNLTISDLYVTIIADSMSFMAKIEGEQFFDKFPGLCQTIASLCTVSCVTSMMTIAVMSFNRYIYVCAHDKYEIIFKKWNCICICISLYIIGGMFVLLNAANIGDHGFDRKSLECIWDRMAAYPYTVVFSITLVWIPSLVTGLCYLRIFLYVRSHRRRIRHQNSTDSNSNTNNRQFVRSFNLARTLFIIYVVFITCWMPYALLIVIDSQDTFPPEVHLYITMFAHLHPSLNWLIYYITNKKFAAAYKALFTKICRRSVIEIGNTTVPIRRSQSINHTARLSNGIVPILTSEEPYVIPIELQTSRIENSKSENVQGSIIETAC